MRKDYQHPSATITLLKIASLCLAATWLKVYLITLPNYGKLIPASSSNTLRYPLDG
jgi:hypothetical protein